MEREEAHYVIVIDEVLDNDDVVHRLIHDLQSVDVGEDRSIFGLIDLKSFPKLVKLVCTKVIQISHVLRCSLQWLRIALASPKILEFGTSLGALVGNLKSSSEAFSHQDTF